MFGQRIVSPITRVLAGAFLCAAAGSTYAAPTWKFTTIARTGVIAGQRIVTLGPAAMNDAGVIVFSGCASTVYPYNCEIYQTSVSNLAAGPALVAAGTDPEIDNNGTILFGCSGQDPTAAICTQSGVLIHNPDMVGGQTFHSPLGYRISGNGQITFLASWTPTVVSPPGNSTVAYGLFTPSALLLKTCEQMPLLSPCGGPSGPGAPGSIIGGDELERLYSAVINDAGTVAFVCGFDPPASSSTTLNGGICTPSAILVRAGTTIGGLTVQNFGGLAINDAGTVVFDGTLNDGDNAIFTPSAVLLQNGDSLGGYTIAHIYPRTFSVNDSGTLAVQSDFEVQPGVLNAGIFTSAGLVFQRGDAIDGTNTIVLGTPQILNSGAILFRVYFDTNMSNGALVLAEPPCAPPSITGVSASPSAIWPPDRMLVPVNIGYSVASSCDAKTSLSVTVSSALGGGREPASNKRLAPRVLERVHLQGEDQPPPTWIIVDPHSVDLRADMDAIYTITISSTNAAGTSTASVQVPVRRDPVSQ